MFQLREQLYYMTILQMKNIFSLQCLAHPKCSIHVHWMNKPVYVLIKVENDNFIDAGARTLDLAWIY